MKTKLKLKLKQIFTFLLLSLCMTSYGQFDQRCYEHATFKTLPDRATKIKLGQDDIQLLSYTGHNEYLISFPCTGFEKMIDHYGIAFTTGNKNTVKRTVALRAKLASGNYENLDLSILFYGDVKAEIIKNYLAAIPSLQILAEMKNSTMVWVNLSSKDIDLLEDTPIVRLLDLKPIDPKPLNHDNINLHGINKLHQKTPLGYGLSGNGVCIGVGDGGVLGSHIDLIGHTVNEAEGSNFGIHADHVTGTLAGKGNLNPRYRGTAFKSDVIIENSVQLILKTEDFINTYGMVLTNNSYGEIFDCNLAGSYDFVSNLLDWQQNQHPQLLHVYAAGNNGNMTCGDFPQSFHTMLNSYQSAKNVLTVGNISTNGMVASNSGRGPTKDGRIKPEICALGVNTISTSSINEYVALSGTSMATPVVTGALALLYEDYKSNNEGLNPDGALMKAVVCNTADDLGIEGPDFTYGFGKLNAQRAIDVLRANQYADGFIEDGDLQSHIITVPEGLTQLKVMLYWGDKEGDFSADKTLVNNLDLVLINPNGEQINPWVLNAAPSQVMNVATRGIDNQNNIEQVTLDLPTGGVYEIVIDGNVIPFGPQKYFITYDFIYPELVLNHPIGQESFIPGNNELIYWEVEKSNNLTFKLEYTLDNGSNWLTIAEGIAADQRSYNWVVPNDITTAANIRISRSLSEGFKSPVSPFSILDTISNFTIHQVCDKGVNLSWDPLAFANTYEIFQLSDDGDMIGIGNTGSNFYEVEGLEPGMPYWFAISAKSPSGNTNTRNTAKIFHTFDPLAFEPITVEAMIQPTSGGQENGSIALEVTGGLAPYTFNWLSNPLITSNIENLMAGSYTVTVVDAKECEYINTYEVEGAVNVPIIQDNFKVALGPNPSYGTLNIQVELESIADLSIKVLDNNGQILKNQTIIDQSVFDEQIDLNDFPAGWYLVSIESDEIQHTQKIVLLK